VVAVGTLVGVHPQRPGLTVHTVRSRSRAAAEHLYLVASKAVPAFGHPALSSSSQCRHAVIEAHRFVVFRRRDGGSTNGPVRNRCQMIQGTHERAIQTDLRHLVFGHDATSHAWDRCGAAMAGNDVAPHVGERCGAAHAASATAATARRGASVRRCAILPVRSFSFSDQPRNDAAFRQFCAAGLQNSISPPPNSQISRVRAAGVCLAPRSCGRGLPRAAFVRPRVASRRVRAAAGCFVRRRVASRRARVVAGRNDINRNRVGRFCVSNRSCGAIRMRAQRASMIWSTMTAPSRSGPRAT
jgi:hypothetical protein